MRPFTIEKINDDTLPINVKTRLLGVKDAIRNRCQNGQLRYDSHIEFSDDWIIENDDEREQVRNNFQGVWICENEWKSERCGKNSNKCCNINLWYHYNVHHTWQNAIWIQVNGKNIFIHSPISDSPNAHIRFSVFSSLTLPLYYDSHIRTYMGLPNPPLFVPEFNNQPVNRKQINGNFPDIDALIDRVLVELCYLCTK